MKRTTDARYPPPDSHRRDPACDAQGGGDARTITRPLYPELDGRCKDVLLRTLQEASLDGILLVDAEGRIVACNRQFLEVWNIPETLVLDRDNGARRAAIVAQVKEPARFLAEVQRLYRQRGESSRGDVETRDGRTIDWYTVPVQDEDGNYFGRIWYVREVTAERRSANSLRRANRALLVLNAANQAIVRSDSEQAMLEAICQVFLHPGGYRLTWVGMLEQDADRSIRPVAHSGNEADYVEMARCSWADSERGRGPAGRAARTGSPQVCRDFQSDPDMRPWRSHAAARDFASTIALPLSSGNGDIFGVIAIYADDPNAFDEEETQLLVRIAGDVASGVQMHRNNQANQRAVARAQRMALFDPVTELPNRTLLLEDLNAAARHIDSAGKGFGVLSIQVVTIEEINVILGFGTSDALITTIAGRLQEICRETEFIAHLGGGEFAVRLEAGPAEDAEAVISRAQAIRMALKLPVTIGETEVVPRCTVGIAIYPTDNDDVVAVLGHAQAARINAQGREGKEIAFFGPQESARVMREIALESALHLAIDRGEISLVYQPQVDLQSGEIVAVEALMRWNSAKFGAVSPVEFIPLAERSPLIGVLGEWALREACRQAVEWHRRMPRAPRIAVNLSSSQISRAGVAAQIQAITFECGCDPQWLGLEITESMLIENPQETAQALRELKAIGFEISLDDFGTGYSSLSRLNQLPIDVVKIDRSFVADVMAATEDVSVTRAIITLSHSMQMRVLAEGVETEGQLGLLAANACDLIQGFLFSPPVAPEAIESMLRENRRLPEKFLLRHRGERTLLLVDDEENILSALRRLLRNEGYRIICASSGAEGLMRLAESRVDVIVSDQRMPGMTGVEFLRRAKEIYPDTLRMVLSGYTDLQSTIDAVNEGAIYKFLTKPWDDERLRGHIAEAFRQKCMADENRRLARELQQANDALAGLNTTLRNSLATREDDVSLLERSNLATREILDSVPAPIIGVDTDGIVAFVNQSAERCFPGLVTALGAPVDECLAPEILGLVRLAGAAEVPVQLDGARYRAFACDLQSNGRVQGRLVVLLPSGVAAVEPLR